MDNTYFIQSADIIELREMVEDTLQYFCDEHMVSGELSWIILEALAKAKQAEFRGEFNESTNT